MAASAQSRRGLRPDRGNGSAAARPAATPALLSEAFRPLVWQRPAEASGLAALLADPEFGPGATTDAGMGAGAGVSQYRHVYSWGAFQCTGDG